MGFGVFHLRRVLWRRPDLNLTSHAGGGVRPSGAGCRLAWGPTLGPASYGACGQGCPKNGATIIIRTLVAAARAFAFTDGTNAPAQAGDDFNREMTDSEMSRIVAGDPGDAPSYSDPGAGNLWDVITPGNGRRFVDAWRRRSTNINN